MIQNETLMTDEMLDSLLRIQRGARLNRRTLAIINHAAAVKLPRAPKVKQVKVKKHPKHKRDYYNPGTRD